MSVLEGVAERRFAFGSAPRLLDGIVSGAAATSLASHLAVYGPLELGSGRELLAAVEASGLQGRGGAGFPAGIKMRAVTQQRGRPLVVANGLEGEPVSGKDKVLLRCLPQLVLDGAVAAAAAVGARDVVVAVADSARPERVALEHALRERRAARMDGRVRLAIAAAPNGFVSGEETALVQFLDRGVAKPTFTPPLPFERGVGCKPTLVQNVETLAHVALIARYGAESFRSAGTADEPGTALVTLSGAVAEPGVYELDLGAPLSDLLARAGGDVSGIGAFLFGGYFGSWAKVTAADAPLSQAGLRAHGARLGARAIVALPKDACGLAETARVLRYLADSSAGQCGPCVHGLDAVATAFAELARPAAADERGRLLRWLGQIQGRGGCRHPDGAAALARSALDVFADEVALHLEGSCSGHGRPLLPVGKAAYR